MSAVPQNANETIDESVHEDDRRQQTEINLPPQRPLDMRAFFVRHGSHEGRRLESAYRLRRIGDFALVDMIRRVLLVASNAISGVAVLVSRVVHLAGYEKDRLR